MNRTELGAEYKRSHNCCQAVLLAYEDKPPYDKEALLMLGSTFGSGMGGMKGTCGALTGAEMVLGMLGYRGSSMNKYSREVFARFEELCGASACIDIKGVLTGRVLCSCEDCCRHAASIVESMLTEG